MVERREDAALLMGIAMSTHHPVIPNMSIIIMMMMIIKCCDRFYFFILAVIFLLFERVDTHTPYSKIKKMRLVALSRPCFHPNRTRRILVLTPIVPLKSDGATLLCGPADWTSLSIRPLAKKVMDGAAQGAQHACSCYFYFVPF
jgi:hypothetical protein